MKMRLIYLGLLFGFSILGYWGHDVSGLELADAATSQDLPTTPAAQTVTAQTVTAQTSAETNPPQPSSSGSALSDGVIKMAISLVSRSRYTDAITLLQSIPPEDKNFAKAKQLQNQSSAAILALAKTKLNQGKFSEGKAILRAVPATTRSYAEATKLLSDLSQFD